MLSLGEALYLSREIFVDLLKRQPDLSSSNITAVSPPGRGNTAIAASSIGSLVTAFLASVCCIGSVVFAALGVGVGATGFLASTAGFLKALVPYRPLFMGLTAVLLGVSLYLAYRKPRAVCVPEAVCVPCAASRVNRTVLWLMAILAVVLILAPYWLEWVTGS
ncbi:mercuric transporter MerT family protein [Nitrospira sp. Kam-Ns4a]